MDYIKEAEKYLWHYRDLKLSLDRINREIIKIKWDGCPADISAINLDGMPHNPKFQDDMINLIYKLKTYQEMQENTQKEINEIDNILKNISKEPGCENYEKVLRLWYIDKKSKEEIAASLNYNSRKSIYTLRNEAIRKFAINLFGLSALKAI